MGLKVKVKVKVSVRVSIRKAIGAVGPRSSIEDTFLVTSELT